MAALYLSDPPLEISALPPSFRESLDSTLRGKLSATHSLLGMDAISTSTACEDFTSSVQNSLICAGLLREHPRAKSSLEPVANRLKQEEERYEEAHEAFSSSSESSQ